MPTRAHALQVVINDADQGVSNDPSALQVGGPSKQRGTAAAADGGPSSASSGKKFRQPGGLIDVLDAMDSSKSSKEQK